MSERSEQGVFITQDPETEYISYQNLPNDWQRTPCGIGVPNDWKSDIPENIIGFAHTHPFYEGEDRRSVCGDVPESYTSGHSAPDYNFLLSIAEYKSDYSIKGYVLDGDNITVFNTITGSTGPEQTVSRCGY